MSWRGVARPFGESLVDSTGFYLGDTMNELYERYGQLMIQAEILNAQIANVKQQIADELNKKPVAPVESQPKTDA